MSHLDRLARRALCLHSKGAAAPLATYRTQAPAVRKRGGGPAHFQPVSAIPLGRQPQPEGGEIDSFCRAAAGIIPLITPLISAHNGARAYLTEGGRRAQKMEPRSANHPSPAAQLVKGYEPPLRMMLTPHLSAYAHAVCVQKSLHFSEELLMGIGHSRRPLHNIFFLARKVLLQFPCKELETSELHLPGVRELQVNKLCVRELCKVSNRLFKLAEIHPENGRIGGGSIGSTCHDLHARITKGGHVERLAHVVILAPLSLDSRSSSLSTAYPKRSNYRTKPPKRLHPSRGIRWQPPVLDPIGCRANQKPRCCGSEHQPPQTKQGPLFPLASLHRSALPLTKLRLPAPASLVHGGAA